MQMSSGRSLNSTCDAGSLKNNGLFCHLTPTAAREFESIKFISHHQAGSVLFLENDAPRGIFLVCSGKVKLSVSSRGGKSLTLQIARPGDMLGLSASMSGVPYEVSAETLYPSQVAFIRSEDFIRFASRYPEVFQAVVRQVTSQYAAACQQLRTVGLSTTAPEKLARWFLHWSSDEKQTSPTASIKMGLTHEQIAECVGSTRETVTRTLGEFKSKHLVTIKGATVMIPNRAALQAVCGD
jgi:CRP/FNR family transcriptional regulator, cyclic AMP receptor protein